MKKILALVLALAMILAVTAASAATITVTQNPGDAGTAGNETYNAYKIFDMTSTEEFTQTDSNLGAGTKKGFAYTMPADSAWMSAVEGTGAFTLTLSADRTVYNVTLRDGFNTEAKAKEIAAYLMGHIPSSVSPVTFHSNETPVTVDDGYYIITSSLGTNLIAATANVNLTTKNSYITDKKEVAKTNWNVGDHVPYTITVNIPASTDYTKPVIVHDTMDDVLALIDTTVAATLGGSAFSGITLVKSDAFGTDHETSHAAATGKVLFDFVLDITSLAPATGTDPVDKSIIITYEAELTSAAAADQGFVNEEFTSYSEYKTKPNDVEVKTYDFDLKKTFAGDPAKELQATFKLYPTVGSAKGTEAIKFIDGGTVTGKDITYVKADSNDTGSSDIIIAKTDSTGKNLITNVRGLAAGTYYLTEQTTADGYNLLTADVVITIDDDGKVASAELKDGFITVENLTGTVLPSTGGIGTTIFYVLGGILVIGAAVILVARRKAHD